MKLFTLMVLLTAFIALTCNAADPVPATAPSKKINVLLVTGRRDIQKDPFLQIFASNPDITFTLASDTKTISVFSRPDLATFDVIFLTDLQSKISADEQKNFLALLDRGTGIVCMHDALLSYQKFPDYEKIVGGKYLLDTEKLPDGSARPESTVKRKVLIPLTVVDNTHPISAGLKDQTLDDSELYQGVPTTSDIHILLTAPGTNPNPQPMVWTREEKKSRIASIVFGHGPAHKNPTFITLVNRSILWTAHRL